MVGTLFCSRTSLTPRCYALFLQESDMAKNGESPLYLVCYCLILTIQLWLNSKCLRGLVGGGLFSILQLLFHRRKAGSLSIFYRNICMAVVQTSSVLLFHQLRYSQVFAFGSCHALTKSANHSHSLRDVCDKHVPLIKLLCGTDNRKDATLATETLVTLSPSSIYILHELIICISYVLFLPHNNLTQ